MLTACLIVRDGAKTLTDCLTSLQGLVDEIVIVMDPRTKDESEQIARDFNAKIFTRNFDNFSAQRNYALSKSSGDWILSVDADEQISPGLKLEILQVLKHPKADGYFIPRLNRIFSRDIYYTNWGPQDDTHLWLFMKSKAHWEGIVHEEVVLNGKSARLKNYKLHYSYKTVTEFISKMNQYTSFNSGADFTYMGMWFTAFKDFFRRFIWHRGFLDGYHGLFLSYLMVIYHLSSYVKAWQKSHFR